MPRPCNNKTVSMVLHLAQASHGRYEQFRMLLLALWHTMGWAVSSLVAKRKPEILFDPPLLLSCMKIDLSAKLFFLRSQKVLFGAPDEQQNELRLQLNMNFLHEYIYLAAVL